MTPRQRILLLTAISVAALIVVVAFGGVAYLQSQAERNAPSAVAVTPVTSFAGARIDVRQGADEVHVTVVAEVKGPGGLFDFLPGLDVRAEAVAAREGGGP